MYNLLENKENFCSDSETWWIYGKNTDTPEEVVNETESGRSINFVFEKLPTGTHKVFAQIS